MVRFIVSIFASAARNFEGFGSLPAWAGSPVLHAAYATVPHASVSTLFDILIFYL
jgi:hypothetical protein